VPQFERFGRGESLKTGDGDCYICSNKRMQILNMNKKVHESINNQSLSLLYKGSLV
jgi:hypothetical protein